MDNGLEKPKLESLENLPVTPEKQTEAGQEKVVGQEKKAPKKGQERVLPTAKKSLPPKKVLPVAKSASLQKIENILQEDLETLYLKLPKKDQTAFKLKGEQTASEIDALMRKVKINIKKIILLIVNWLKMIPAVNKFFIEQEAKIKADKILNEVRIKKL